MRKVIFIIFLFATSNVAAQQLEAFETLCGNSWTATGQWGDGSPFVQQMNFSFSLDSNIVIVETFGFVDQTNTQYGHRNHGIRKWNAKLNQIEFWEFDVFGTLTKGSIKTSDKDISYYYDYGDYKMIDRWTFVNDSTYNYTVGSLQNGVIDEVYLETVFKRK